MVLPQSCGGLAFWVVLALLAPTAVAQLPSPPSVGEPIPEPDLIPGNSRVNATYHLQPVEVCATAMNIRGNAQTTHPPFDVVLYLDGFEEGARRVRQVLASGQGAEVCWQMTLPSGWHRYHFVVDALDDVKEHNESNNVARQAWFYIDVTPAPELIVEGFEIYPRIATEGRPQIFSAVVRNVGNAPSPRTELQFIDETGSLGTLSVDPLAVGERDEVVLLTDPSIRPSGTFTGRAVVDPGANVTEGNESNNERVLAYEVPDHPLPDLRVSNLTIEGSLVARSTLRLNVTIENMGDRNALPFVIRVFDNDKPLLNTSRGGLGVGQNTTARFLLSVAEGQHEIRVEVDPENQVAERDEENNVVADFLDVVAPESVVVEPNLLVERVDAAPNDPRPGETVMLVAFVRNTADTVVNETTVEFTINGVPLGSVRAPALDPGHYASVTFSWPVQDEGSYTIRAAADVANEVAEADEGDNELARTFVVISPPAPSPPPPTPATPQPTTPSAPTPTTPAAPTAPTAPTPGADDEMLVIGEVSVNTRGVEDGVKGIVVASLRNPRLEPLGRVSLAFSVDGRTVKTVLLDGLGGGATSPVSTGEIDLPAGAHTVKVEASLLGGAKLASGEKTYDQEAARSGIPSAGLVAALAVSGAAALAVRRRR